MGQALAASLDEHSPTVGVRVCAQDYCCESRWLADLGASLPQPTVSQGHPHLRWLNKLDAISRSEAGRTLFLDTDMLVTKDISGWFDELATDDLTFWNFRRRPADVPEGAMILNQLNPHPFCRHYGVEAVPIMLEATENPDALYWKFAGKGNFVGDEPAASMAVVEMGVKLPAPSPMAPNPPVGCFMAPWQRWTEVNLAEGRAKYWCEWSQAEVEPSIVHFAGGGKDDPVYQAHVRQRWAAANPRHEPPCANVALASSQ